MIDSRRSHEVIQLALWDAIEWNKSILEASRGFDPSEDQRHERRISDCRKMLKRRFGDNRTPAELADDKLGETISVEELLKRAAAL